MRPNDHNKLLGVFFAVHSGLTLFGTLVAIIGYGVLGSILIGSRRTEEQTMGTILLIGAVVAIPIGLLFVLPQALAAYKLLKRKSGARFWAIFAAIVALFGFPLGTALGVYALWFLFGDAGKNYFAQNERYSPPPPPNSWR